MITVATD